MARAVGGIALCASIDSSQDCKCPQMSLRADSRTTQRSPVFIGLCAPAAPPSLWKVFLGRLEARVGDTIQAVEVTTDEDLADLAFAITRSVKAMQDNKSGRSAGSFGFTFPAVVWTSDLLKRYDNEVALGSPMRNKFASYGARDITNGMFPFLGCSSANSPQGTGEEGDLGLPCKSGGSVARTETDMSGTLIICMLFYLPDAETIAIRVMASLRKNPANARPGYTNDPPGRVAEALELCRRHQARKERIDLTEMAWCLYYNYPYLQEDIYPPESHGSGIRLRGVIVFPGGEGDVIPEGAIVEAPEGELLKQHLDMMRLQLNANAVYLTCVVALPA